MVSISAPKTLTLLRARAGNSLALPAMAIMLSSFVLLFVIQDLIWPFTHRPIGWFEHFVWWLTLFWAGGVHIVSFGIIGMFLYRKNHRDHANWAVSPIPQIVSFRIVSRGENSAALSETVQNVRDIMGQHPLFDYRIEVVTDLDVPLEPGPDLTHFIVPDAYETPRGARYKARALQYALDYSELPKEAWIMHLDEESHIGQALVEGIATAVAEEEASGKLRIGQGAILYHRDVKGNVLLTLADSIRTGDDAARFYLQNRIGRPLFGFHGSFILVRCDVEREVGFDFGLKGSVTEDAWWALEQMARGRKCRWVDGFVYEQATSSVRDFLKQRRRWFVGLVLCVIHAPVALRHRAVLGLSILAWSVGWLGIAATILNLFGGSFTPMWLRIIANFSYAVYITYYVLGLKLNLDNLPQITLARKGMLYVLQVVLIPAFALMEGAGVLYGMIRPNMGFHVVKK